MVKPLEWTVSHDDEGGSRLEGRVQLVTPSTAADKIIYDHAWKAV